MNNDPPIVGGASGAWTWTRVRRLGARAIVVQTDEQGCGPACAEMLLKDRGFEVSQAELRRGLPLPVSAERLAARMTEMTHSRWLGAYATLDEGATWEFVAHVSASHGSWAALLEPLGFRQVGHWVVVDGVSEEGVVWIRDPAGGAYGIPIDEFLGLWHYTMMVIEEDQP